MTSNTHSHKRPADVPTFLYGTTYYPEHWDAETRELDGERMAEAGFNCVRMAEFAWDRMEPEEGTYQFDLFDRTIAKLGDRGISTILGTPTATPPRWLTFAHPEVLTASVCNTARANTSVRAATFSVFTAGRSPGRWRSTSPKTRMLSGGRQTTN